MISSNTPDDEIVTLGLGSCVAVVVAHAPSRSGAMAHIAFPSSRLPQRLHKDYPPAYFANLAVPALIESLAQYTDANPRLLEVSLIGGAGRQSDSTMAIGTKNTQAILEQLSKLGIAPRHQLLGGQVSRNVRLEIGSGAIWVKEANAPERVLAPAQGHAFKKRTIEAN